MYIYSQVDFFFFFFLTLDCESMTTGHLSLLHMGYMSVCMLAHRHAWASLAVPCGGSGPSPAALAREWDLPGRVAQDRTPHWGAECYPEQAKKKKKTKQQQTHKITQPKPEGRQDDVVFARG